MTTLEYAQTYLESGYIPVWLHGVDLALNQCACGNPACPGPGKRPFLPDWPNIRPDAAMLSEWFEKHPGSNIGLLAGRVSNIVVLDVDRRNGGFETLEKHPVLPPTLTAQTGGDGRHYVFAYPDGVTIDSKKLGPGLDLLSDGAQFVVAPSLHLSGNFYSWLNQIKPATVPDWIIAAGNGKAPAEYLVEQIRPGERHDVLLRFAGLFRRYGMSGPEIESALSGINTARCTVPMSDHDISVLASSMEKYQPEASAVESLESSTPIQESAYADAAILGSALVEQEIERPESVIGDGLLVVGTTGILYGPSGVGKTFGAMEMSLSVALGEPWFGIETSKSASCYVALEIPRYYLKRRLLAVAGDSKAGLDRMAMLARDDLPGPMNLADPAIVPILAAFVSRFEARLLVIDTLARAQAGDVSDDENVVAILNNLDAITKQTQSACLLVHHDRKSAPGKKDAGGLDSLRGSQILNGYANLLMHLGKHKGLTILTCEKANFGQEFDPIWLDRTSTGKLRRTTTPDEARDNAEKNKSILANFCQAADQWLSASFIAEGCPLMGPSKKPITERTYQNYLTGLVDSGTLEQKGERRGRQYRYRKDWENVIPINMELGEGQ